MAPRGHHRGRNDVVCSMKMSVMNVFLGCIVCVLLFSMMTLSSSVASVTTSADARASLRKQDITPAPLVQHESLDHVPTAAPATPEPRVTMQPTTAVPTPTTAPPTTAPTTTAAATTSLPTTTSAPTTPLAPITDAPSAAATTSPVNAIPAPVVHGNTDVDALPIKKASGVTTEVVPVNSEPVHVAAPVVVDSSNDATTLTPERLALHSRVNDSASRQVTVASFKDSKRFLKTYNSSDPLFVFFTCAHDPATNATWQGGCNDAEATVAAAFARAPPSARLLTVVVQSDSEFQSMYRFDDDLRLLELPTLFQYTRLPNGHGKTTAGLYQAAMKNPELLDYVFHGESAPGVTKKDIRIYSEYAPLKKFLRDFEDDFPLYLLFVSGRLPTNDRPWCPYCRFRETAFEFAYHKFAASNAVVVKVEVSADYTAWKDPNNEFKKPFDVHSVPALRVVHRDLFEKLVYHGFYGSVDDVVMLQQLFERDASFVTTRPVANKAK
ncbi:hypothetical protein SPRG_03644 [Saprolegnia parasitica CBS 223.65]|uniref:Thioredoxin domain-containing protein n=1 Tax=Saprolegnia parasitica (strain CBS 223.65) TaxID=695850 RepID=A0A067CY71_SAPPC|nr:hypothetical protein SPRG_03644 [Saprolegnia parasitica CBS 223.65]KDO31727.1 hypothetical protein SPRG_03644 [Saprolegnia parasitica CBS 223.65]|eukprot:XP_012197609.1 hypothetical protein SPRG_03644 [Saprolegnia parasitica CBS 223.65]